MRDLKAELRRSLRDREYADIYSESFQDMYLATQVKILREQRGLSQSELGKLIGTTQGGISRIEDSNYSSWSVKTLKKIARAFKVRLRISMEEFGTLPDQVLGMNEASLMRAAHENDLVLFPEKMSAEAASKVRSIGERKAEDEQQYSAGIDGGSGIIDYLPEDKKVLANQISMNGYVEVGAMYGNG
jgi:transcriptional regulator with XRE-family HTH domain